jgi:hypothetical protein
VLAHRCLLISLCAAVAACGRPMAPVASSPAQDPGFADPARREVSASVLEALHDSSSQHRLPRILLVPEAAPHDSTEAGWLDSLLIFRRLFDGLCFAPSPCQCQRESPSPAVYISLTAPRLLSQDTLRVQVDLAETYISGVSAQDLSKRRVLWSIGYHPTVILLTKQGARWSVVPTPREHQIDMVGDGFCEY